MKKILIGMFILSSTGLFAQDNRDEHDRDHRDHRSDQVPENVQRSFQREYPNVQNTQWTNSNGQWLGRYRDANNRDVDTYYNSNGQRIDTHWMYNQNDVPASVRQRADRSYHSNYNTYRIERPNEQPVYQVRSEDGRTIYMDENGRKRKYKDRH